MRQQHGFRFDNLPPVALLSSTDYTSWGRNVLRLFQGLRAAGVDVSLLLLDQKSPPTDGVAVATIKGKPAKPLYAAMHTFALRRYSERPYGYEVFYSNKSPIVLADHPIVRRAGLLHLHAAHGLLGFPQAVLSDKPLVWTLHNMSPFTGGCVYTAGCAKYRREGCAACPQLGAASGAGDLAAENFGVKREAYEHLDLFALSPSRWMEACAAESLLLGGCPHSCIPSAVDIGAFSPMPQKQARALFALPPDKKILVFSASDNERRNKGYHILVQTLELLRRQGAQKELCLLILGKLNDTPIPQGYECCLPGFLEDKTLLAAAYSAADVFVLPSFQDNCPGTLLEAQACGTPGIAFHGNTGEETIRDGVTGYLTTHPGLPLEEGSLPPGRHGAYRSLKPESIEDLAAAITKVLDLPPDAYAAMRRACREHAVATYAPELEIARHLQLYRRRLGLPEIALPPDRA